MAKVVVTLRVMPESPEVNLDQLQKEVLKIIKNVVGDTETKVEKQPIGFGLNALNVLFVMDENKKTEDIENRVRNLEEVQSVDVTDVRRAIG
ncbi:MAG: elongation factor 1-beta [Nanoarchaeota archaeon]